MCILLEYLLSPEVHVGNSTDQDNDERERSRTSMRGHPFCGDNRIVVATAYSSLPAFGSLGALCIPYDKTLQASVDPSQAPADRSRLQAFIGGCSTRPFSTAFLSAGRTISNTSTLNQRRTTEEHRIDNGHAQRQLHGRTDQPAPFG